MPLVTLLQRDRDWLALLWAQAERDAEAERMRQIDEALDFAAQRDSLVRDLRARGYRL